MIPMNRGGDRPLSGLTVAVLTASGFNEFEMSDAQRTLMGAGASVQIISVDAGLVNGWNGTGWGHYFTVNQPINTALAVDFDALVVLGGERAVQKLKTNAHTRRFVGSFFLGQKPVAAFNEALDVLIHVGAIEKMTVTGPEKYRPLVTAVGGEWSDEKTIISRALLTGSVTAEGMKDMMELVCDHFVDASPVHMQAA